MILHTYLADVPPVLHGLAERLAETDLSLFGFLAGCLIVFCISGPRKKSDPARLRQHPPTRRPPGSKPDRPRD